MKVLIACEESQAVCIAMRNNGHEAYSCDIQECSGGHPEWHIMQDALPLINGDCTFTTMDGQEHRIDGEWDLLIAHPPCTHLAVSGARHFKAKLADGRQREAVEFFCQFVVARCKKIAIENPVGIISGEYVENHFPDLAEKYGLPRKPNQIIQPYMFGHPTSKKTCLWLVGLPTLTPTKMVEVEDVRVFTIKRGKNVGKTVRFSEWYNRRGEDVSRTKHRNKTFLGIAQAMADQWAGKIDEEENQ